MSANRYFVYELYDTTNSMKITLWKKQDQTDYANKYEFSTYDEAYKYIDKIRIPVAHYAIVVIEDDKMSDIKFIK
ncbi:MAG: hypothetical protein K2X50_09235 [Gammaproteobacteria bacterium]|nr:hypothetical protein [Gammaproteobacteria bacterium]